MVKAQLSESVIVSKIGTSKTSFDLSVDGLIALKNAGVSDNIIHAMLESQRDAASGQAKNSTIKKRLRGHTRAVMCVAFSPDGKILASGGEDRAIILWDVATADKLRELSGHSRAILALAFNPDGRLLASGSRDSTILLWDRGTGERVWRLRGGPELSMGFVYSVAFSPDGRMLASARQKKIILWDVSSRGQIASLSGHSGFIGSVYSVAFSPDGRILASGGRDKTIMLWDMVTKKAKFQRDVPPGTRVAALTGHSQAVSSVAFSPDGKTLASAGSDQIILWDLANVR
jgi:WD40 repeat protein